MIDRSCRDARPAHLPAARRLVPPLAASLVVGALAPLALTGAARAAAPPTTTSATAGTLSVLGQGRVFVRPNVAHVSAFVRSVARTEAAASASADRGARAVITAVEAQGVPASALKTPSISVNREVLVSHHRRLVRFAAFESVEVRLTDLTLVSPVLAAATRAGADHVSGPSYGFSSPDVGVQAAEHAALGDARTLADAAAATDGVTIVGVQSIDLNPESGVFVAGGSGSPASTAAPSRRAPQPPTRAARIEVDATVAVVYLIARAG